MEPNPKNRLPVPTARASSTASSALSSVVYNPEEFLKLQHKADERLDNYDPVNSGDTTVNFLKVFRDSLSKAGRITLMTEILKLNH